MSLTEIDHPAKLVGGTAATFSVSSTCSRPI
jgi:hypothetical protein